MKVNKAIDYKRELNKSQLEAVKNISGPQLVIAGAGSGKTRTLIYRVAYLIEKGIKPENILLLTFTRKAASNMMERAKKLIDKRALNINGGTYHSLSNSILRRYAAKINYKPNYTIIDKSDSQDVINLIRSQVKHCTKHFPKKKTILDIISKHVNTYVPIHDIINRFYPEYIDNEKDIIKIKENYKIYKKNSNIMDYDDLLSNFKFLLKNFDDVRKKLSSKYSYIMVDEYQDTNRIQAEISCFLASSHQNIMIVGDDSQSIYSFRGATFRNIFEFPNIFKNTKIIKLEQNYRSTQPILNLTNTIITNSKEKYSKSLFTKIKGAGKPLLKKVDTQDEEAAFICDKILSLSETGLNLNKIAVLFRAGWHSNFLELELNRKNIPYQKFGGVKFIDSSHVKDILCLLRISINPLDSIAWFRILLLFENIGAKTAEKITASIINSNGKLEVLKDTSYSKKKFFKPLNKLFNTICKIQTNLEHPGKALAHAVPFLTPLLEEKYEDYLKRVHDIEFLEKIVSNYRTIEELLSSLTIEPPDSRKIIDNHAKKENETLILSTIHSAKGLEWNTVFVINLIDGRFPSPKSLQSADEIEEERRLFYVACTRAKKNLFLTTSKYPFIKNADFYNFHKDFSNSPPSLFLREIENIQELTEEAQSNSLEDSNYNHFDSHLKNDDFSDNLVQRIKDYFE